ncbi:MULTISPECIES: SMP-30/gluconolactonase/LRE family protein [Streptomyces]|uniref:SMP-30/Gluconolactonase/LRE-like region domain-containing protein n=1 Tax=Streptomyces tsukubensis (strain DSM 42081 / NBRC 108919 / NRRL 18488 / 9993) TaxID=1114943 RepID=A0A7G3UDF0_STRT9|nr:MULTISPECIES: hypothetical protein [Streptomyces]MYS66688.1 hypothetical protein [Streptomyces sp. SID5473]QKM68437.1 hypothetical protein STSU_015925 [Streptomyces tsukubensis NRRL18488]TAI43254.1 hypothetical protein EWI31_15690 [Streptomyces tsukubensis]
MNKSPSSSRRFTGAAALVVLTALYVAQAGAVPQASTRVAPVPSADAGEPPARSGDGKARMERAEEADGVAAPVRGAARLNIDSGQQPEGIVAEPDGSVVVTFAPTRQIVRITPSGELRVLATLPAPPPQAETPAVGEPYAGGIVRAEDGTLYVTYATGTDDLTGVWRIAADGGVPRRVVALPSGGLPNGIALDTRSRQLYITDSFAGRVWRAPAAGGPAVVWSADPLLARHSEGFAGANGIRVHAGAVWVTNHDRGTVLRFPVTGPRSAPVAGRPETVAEGLGEIDDLVFTGDGDGLLVAGVTDSRVLLVRDGKGTPVLDEEDGLQNPTALARHGTTVHIASSAQYTLTDPHVLSATLTR